jgi:hypothetical protein
MTIKAPIRNALWFVLGDLGWLTRAQSIVAMTMARNNNEPRTSCVKAVAKNNNEQNPFVKASEFSLPVCAVNAPRHA